MRNDLSQSTQRTDVAGAPRAPLGIVLLIHQDRRRGNSPITLIALRVLGAAIFLMIVMGLHSEKFRRDTKTWRMLLAQAFFNSIGAWTVLAWGQQYVESGLASVLNSTSPIFVFLITALVTRHESLGAGSFSARRSACWVSS
jgi:drug/metabolite transporter (DMT)-like permease